ncbi:Phytoene/squalene synthetase [Pseudooceanicola nitratireducens]|jgi:phytoene/squalene synthetase|uniref:Phytoene/squalene synthetase n=1 Tax=Pseudooceanicola nitratireducens TaxID=517719 RepID=A0A1I1KZ70_9RHOB|nr:squalene/phytoene synthase family protein [Pseudooceanicola nitratireducens]SEJ41852.1 Phytoene/squalene synthetase [Pseudooceanicola nitratireducens]SFC66064.1 Phytoene/squalene synthetase [Pseudooceanicola nitratireducens]
MADFDLNACAALVERGDPVRFRAAMAAPVPARAVLFPLYAFNIEVARAPWVTGEPMIAQMRLQWWRDALAEIAEGGVVKRHEVVTPLALAIRAEDVPALDRLVAARERDISGERFADEAALWSYLEATAGGLIEVAARRLGGGTAMAASAGRALGLVNWLMAVPALRAAGRQPLPEGADIAALAREGLVAFDVVGRGLPGLTASARGAFLPLAGFRGVLRRAARDVAAVEEDRLEPGPFAARLRLALTAATGRLW